MRSWVGELRTDCICLAATAFVAAELKDGAIVKLDVSDTAAVESAVCITKVRGRTLSPAAEALIGEIEELTRAVAKA